MAELELLERIAAHLASAALTPAPSSIGVAEPAAAAALPAIVLSLEEAVHARAGIGAGSELMVGSLGTMARIDLASPVLPTEPSFRLIDAARLHLTLPHGGLVRRDGTSGALGALDLTVEVAGTARPLVSGAPAGLQVSADPVVGTLTFATPLPAAGLVLASYFLGQWERTVEHITGVLRLDVCAGGADDVAVLSAAVVRSLTGPDAPPVPGLDAITLRSMSAVGLSEPAPAPSLRRRTLRLAFQFTLVIDRPASSGGVIARIPVVTDLSDLQVGLATGDISESTTEERFVVERPS